MSSLVGAFTSTLDLSGATRLALMLPLCLSVAVVYKTIRTDRLADVPKAAAILWATIVVGMCAVGAALWVLFRVLL